jgi:hypothetical protein
MALIVNLPTPFRFGLFQAEELLGLLCDERVKAENARKQRVPHDWLAASNTLNEAKDRASLFGTPLAPALRAVNTTLVTCCGVAGELTAFDVLLRLVEETWNAMHRFHVLAAHSTRALTLSPKQRSSERRWLAAIKPIPRLKREELENRLKWEATQASDRVLRGEADPPELAAQRVFSPPLYERYLKEIGVRSGGGAPGGKPAARSGKRPKHKRQPVKGKELTCAGERP